MTRQTCPQTTRYATRQIARIDKTDKSMGFFYNMMDKPIKDSTWKVYTVQGKIDKNAKWLYFGGLYQHKGYFNFDDFQVFIETSHNKWQQLPLPDPGFEDDTAAFNKNWFYLKKRTFFTPRLSTDNPYEDKQAIKIDGSKFIKTQTDGDNDTAGHFITANGIKLYYETYGQGQPLLLLHGNSSSISLFEKQIPDFSKQYQVIAVDTRGQGRSGEDGKTGLIMAMNYPRKVRRLAAMGANVFIDHTVVDDSVYRILHKEQRELKHDKFPGTANRNRLITLLLTEPRHTFPQLKSIHCPVLVMAGQYDLIKDEHTRQIAAHIPRSQLLIFPGGTQYEPADHPATFNKTVLDFFNTPAPK
jgi:pimeloyl-ACP methyl ester carboxylesterase